MTNSPNINKKASLRAKRSNLGITESIAKRSRNTGAPRLLRRLRLLAMTNLGVKVYPECVAVLAITFLLSFTSAVAADKNPVPRFVSLRPNEVNARVGPGPEYPVKWIFVKAGLPVEVTAEFDIWRRIRDVEGAEGWVHQNMLCSKRRAVICCPEALVYSEEDDSSAPLVRVQQGVIIELMKCRGDWCRVQVNEHKGWIRRESLWGVYPQENLG